MARQHCQPTRDSTPAPSRRPGLEPRHRRRHPAAVPDHHLCPGRHRRPAQRLRVRPRHQPHPRLPAGTARRAGRRQAAFSFSLRPGRRGRPDPRAAAPRATTSCWATTSYGGTYRLISRVLGDWGISNTAVDMSDVDAVAAAIAAGGRRRQDPAGLGGDAVESDDEDHRHRRARQAGARRRGPPGGRQHLRLPVPAEPAGARRRRRGALHHQVHRRPLRRRRRRRSWSTTPRWPRRSASCSLPSAPCPARWTPG